MEEKWQRLPERIREYCGDILLMENMTRRKE